MKQRIQYHPCVCGSGECPLEAVKREGAKPRRDQTRREHRRSWRKLKVLAAGLHDRRSIGWVALDLGWRGSCGAIVRIASANAKTPPQPKP